MDQYTYALAEAAMEGERNARQVLQEFLCPYVRVVRISMRCRT